ncbi:ABC transporter ATP-binding protein [Agrobacterium sp. NPDC090273]|uniref:ABC transporter ATP-binding protein n=1 Tax=Agrobacterium sp. NPDC090273 TaxID=3363919 RepID=UPI00383A7234
MSSVLDVRDLRAGYGRVPILDGISFSMGESEFLGILGHNGMGKTTLMKALMGRIPSTSGSVKFLGAEVTHKKTHDRSRAGMGLVPQGREIFPALTVLENLRMGTAALPKEDHGIIDKALSDFPRLKRLLDRPGGALSGGEQQLLALARCLCTQPKLVLLDEPTEGIQPSIIDEIIDTLLAKKAAGELSIVIVEQNLEFLTSLSDRILRIQKGRIVGVVDPHDLDQHELLGA